MKHPQILIPGVIEEINQNLMSKTGCFAFLIPSHQWSYAEPKSGKEAFEIWSVGLYTIYHDYGCGYIRYILDESNAPIPSLKSDIKKSRMHLNTVVNVFRGNIAHGIFDSASRQRLQNQVTKSYFQQNQNDKSWNEFYTQLSDDDWMKAAQCLKKDSDNLVSVLHDWADGFKKSKIPINIFRPREKFGKSKEFLTSISERVVFDSLDRDYMISQKTESAQKILDKAVEDHDKKGSNEMLACWQKDIQKEFLDGNLHSPDDIIAKLRSFLYEVHNPPSASSTTIASKHGFSLEELSKSI